MKKNMVLTAKECAYVAVFTALLIAGQWMLSALPNIEIVTVLFIAYACTFGVRRSLICATAFSFLRQFVFGVFPNVLIVYLLYYNALAVLFGLLGKTRLSGWKRLAVIVAVACVCTLAFSLLDAVVTPFWYGYSSKTAKLYFQASLPFMFTHVVSNALGVSLLFFPLSRVFSLVKKQL